MYQPSQPVQEQIDRTFMYHPPHGDQTLRYGTLRSAARQFANIVAELTPPSREQAVALTKLQECVMFANAAIAINERQDGQQITEETVKQETK